MAIEHPERQYLLTDVVEMLFSDLPTGVAKQVLKLPVNAVLVDGGYFVDTADNGGTSVTLSIGDAGSATRYASAVDIKTAADVGAKFTATKVGKKYATGDHLVATRTEGGTASTAGKVRIWASYAVIDRVNEVQT